MVLEVTDVCKSFQRGAQRVEAVSHVSFAIEKGECVGLIGESGSGKSTLAGLIAGLETPDSGSICFQGKTLCGGQSRQARHMRKDLQLVFQHPVSSFQPRAAVLESVCDGIRYTEKAGRAEVEARAAQALREVGIPEIYYRKKCRALSGGECQRVAIARAVCGNPALIIHDEVTSALDVSIQAQIVRLLYELKEQKEMSYLFISHDIAVVAGLCDRILVMRDGRIIEEGKPEEILQSPKEAYTRQLVLSVLTL